MKDDKELIKLLQTMKDESVMGGSFDSDRAWNRIARNGGFSVSQEKTSYTFRDVVEYGVWQVTHATAKPLAAGLAIFVLVVGGWIGTVNTTFNALPGDGLYAVKIGLERTQLAFSLNTDQRAKLQVEFAGRRLEEMVELSAGSKTQNLHLAVNRFKSELETIKEDLGQSDATNLAKALSHKTVAYQHTVATSVVNLPSDDTLAVQEIIKDTNEQAVDVIITAHELAEDAESVREIETAFVNQVIALKALELDESLVSKLELAEALHAEGAYRRAFQLLKEVELLFEAQQ